MWYYNYLLRERSGISEQLMQVTYLYRMAENGSLNQLQAMHELAKLSLKLSAILKQMVIYSPLKQQ